MKKLPQYLFDLERFGASPAKILARLNGSAANAPTHPYGDNAKEWHESAATYPCSSPSLEPCLASDAGPSQRQEMESPERIFLAHQLGQDCLVSF